MAVLLITDFNSNLVPLITRVCCAKQLSKSAVTSPTWWRETRNDHLMRKALSAEWSALSCWHAASPDHLPSRPPTPCSIAADVRVTTHRTTMFSQARRPPGPSTSQGSMTVTRLPVTLDRHGRTEQMMCGFDRRGRLGSRGWAPRAC